MEMKKSNIYSGIFLLVLSLITLISLCQGMICPPNCFCHRHTVACASLKEFPDSFPMEAEEITIYSSEFDSIPARAFNNLPNVERIIMYSIKTKSISCSAFSGLKGVTGITIYSSEIGSIETGAFSDLSNIGSVSIYTSDIVDIKQYAFSGFEKINHFSIHGSNITTIHSHAFHNFTKVKNVALYRLRVELFQPQVFETLKEVELSVYSSAIKVMKTPVFVQTKLMAVSMYSLKIDELGSSDGVGLFYNGTHTSDPSIYTSTIKLVHCGLFKDYGLQEFTRIATLYNNKIWCNCSTAWMGDKDTGNYNGWGNKCLGPDNIKDRTINSVPDSDFCGGNQTRQCSTPTQVYKSTSRPACQEQTTNDVNDGTNSVAPTTWTIRSFYVLYMLLQFIFS